MATMEVASEDVENPPELAEQRPEAAQIQPSAPISNNSVHSSLGSILELSDDDDDENAEALLQGVDASQNDDTDDEKREKSGGGRTSRSSIIDSVRSVGSSVASNLRASQQVGTGVFQNLPKQVVQGGATVATNVREGVVKPVATFANMGTSVATNVGKGVVVPAVATVAHVGTAVATNVGKGVVQGGATVVEGAVQGGAVVRHGMVEGGKILESGVRDQVKRTRRHLLGLEDYTWEELKQIEKRRREILRRRNLSFFRILTFWDGTVLSALGRDPFVYVLMALYIVLRVAARTHIPYYVAALAESDVAIIGGFLSFFLVFYAKETNDRFYHQYQLSMESEQRIFDAASLARTTLPRERALRLIRYLNAAHIAGYIGVAETYTFENLFINQNSAKGLLSASELERVIELNMDNGGSCHRELCTWALSEVQSAEMKGMLNARLAQFYRDVICKLRSNFGAIYAYDDQPVGFFYLHFVCLLTFLYLPLFTIQTSLNAGTGEEVYW